MRFEKVAEDGRGRRMWRSHVLGHGEIVVHEAENEHWSYWRVHDTVTGTSESFDNFEDMTDFVRQRVAKLREQHTDALRRVIVEALADATAAARSIREAR